MFQSISVVVHFKVFQVVLTPNCPKHPKVPWWWRIRVCEWWKVAACGAERTKLRLSRAPASAQRRAPARTSSKRSTHRRSCRRRSAQASASGASSGAAQFSSTARTSFTAPRAFIQEQTRMRLRATRGNQVKNPSDPEEPLGNE